MSKDLCGQKSLLNNLFSGWLANGLQIISGFVLPRLISDELGQGSLGVWDFGWAVVSYFALLQGGIVSSVNRYVAKFRAVGDTHNLNIAVNSVGGVLKAIAAAIAVLSFVLAWTIPQLMPGKLDGLTNEARWVVLWLGLTAAVQVQGAVYGGVVTGCHRWTIQNGIKMGVAVLSLGLGVMVILVGGTIAWLAGVMLFSELGLRFAQRIAARKVCPELEISSKYFRRKTAIEMSRFGGKAYVSVIGQMLVNQTTSVLVASTFGVAALAIFSRPRSLVRAFSTLINNNALVIVPVISALDAAGKLPEIRVLAVTATRYAVFACLPLMLFLITLGGDVMTIWMGESYVDSVLLSLFAVSGLTEAMCFPLYRMLMGMDRHGRLGMMNLVTAVVTVALVTAVALLLHSNLRWIALAVAFPSMFVNAILLPRLAARVLQISFAELARDIWLKPVLCCLPAALWLVAITFLFGAPPVQRLSLGAAGALVLSGWPYWVHAIPERVKLVFRFA